MAVLGQKVISGVVPDVKLTELVRAIRVTRVPFPEEEIIVPFPVPGGVLPASLKSVRLGYPVIEFTIERVELNCCDKFNPDPVLSYDPEIVPPEYISELNSSPS
jgi:hypothetical protein